MISFMNCMVGGRCTYQSRIPQVLALQGMGEARAILVGLCTMPHTLPQFAFRIKPSDFFFIELTNAGAGYLFDKDIVIGDLVADKIKS